MTPIASHITAFLRERLPLQRRASLHTCESYAYTFQLLFAFASERLALTPSDLCLEHLDAQLVMDFLAHLETQRSNGPSTRNMRLAAIKSFMRGSCWIPGSWICRWRTTRLLSGSPP